MPTNKEITDLVVNKVDTLETYKAMKANGKINENELYLIQELNEVDKVINKQMNEFGLGLSMPTVIGYDNLANLQGSGRWSVNLEGREIVKHPIYEALLEQKEFPTGEKIQELYVLGLNKEPQYPIVGSLNLSKLVRHYVIKDGVGNWGAWAWDNPPLTNDDYLTTEYIQGKPLVKHAIGDVIYAHYEGDPVDNPDAKAVPYAKFIGAAFKEHTHTKNEITDFPSSLPASDVSDWAKEPNKPTYTANEVGAAPTGFGLGENSTQITDWDSARKNGWYGSDVGAKNAPDSTSFWFGEVSNMNDDVVVQKVWGFTNIWTCYHCVRFLYPNAGTPWQWDNPPLLPEVVYLTTELMDNRSVYKKNVGGEIYYCLDYTDEKEKEGKNDWKPVAPNAEVVKDLQMHWWKKIQGPEYFKIIGDSLIHLDNDLYPENSTVTFDTYSTLEVNELTGDFEPDGYQAIDIRCDWDMDASALKGRYFKSKTGEYYYAESPSLSDYGADDDSYFYLYGVKAVSVDSRPIYQEVAVVSSTNPDEYPHNGRKDGYQYEYLGIPFINAMKGIYDLNSHWWKVTKSWYTEARDTVNIMVEYGGDGSYQVDFYESVYVEPAVGTITPINPLGSKTFQMSENPLSELKGKYIGTEADWESDYTYYYVPDSATWNFEEGDGLSVATIIGVQLIRREPDDQNSGDRPSKTFFVNSLIRNAYPDDGVKSYINDGEYHYKYLGTPLAESLKITEYTESLRSDLEKANKELLDLYNAQALQDEALIELYEMMEGKL